MEYNKYTVTVGLIRFSEGKAYLSQRVNTKNFVGRWQFAGGKLEEGEIPVDGGVREVEEETGLKIETNRLSYFMPILEDPTTDVCHAFLVELTNDEIPKRTEHHKMTDWVLVTFDEALKLDLMPGLRIIFNKLKTQFDRLEKV
jgi:mutator protein MutT